MVETNKATAGNIVAVNGLNLSVTGDTLTSDAQSAKIAEKNFEKWLADSKTETTAGFHLLIVFKSFLDFSNRLF